MPRKPGIARRILVAVVVIWLLLVVTAKAEIIDRVVAVVDGQVITLTDALAAVRFGFAQPQPGSDPIRAAIDRLIERQLVLIEVERYGPPEPPAAAIEQAVAEVRARFGSASQLAAALAQSGLAEDQLRRRIRDDLRIRTYLDQRFAAVGAAVDPDRRQALVRDWIAGLRRRAEVIVLYEPPVSR